MISKFEELKPLFKQLSEIETKIKNAGDNDTANLKVEKTDVEIEINTIIGTVDLNKIKMGAYNEILKDLEYQKKFIYEMPNQEKTVQMSINRIRNRVNRIKNFNHKIDNNEPEAYYKTEADEVNGNMA